MKLLNDDPKLTAYALGELSESERREIELVLARSPELRSTLEEIQLAAASLREEFAEETAGDVLSGGPRILENHRNIIPLPFRVSWPIMTTVAATIAAILAWQFWLGTAGSTRPGRTRSLIASSTPNSSANGEKFDVNNVDFREFGVALNRHASLGLMTRIETLRFAYDVPLLVQGTPDAREIFNVSVSYNRNF